jgi:hypothetical protein
MRRHFLAITQAEPGAETRSDRVLNDRRQKAAPLAGISRRGGASRGRQYRPAERLVSTGLTSPADASLRLDFPDSLSGRCALGDGPHAGSSEVDLLQINHSNLTVRHCVKAEQPVVEICCCRDLGGACDICRETSSEGRFEPSPYRQRRFCICYALVRTSAVLGSLRCSAHAPSRRVKRSSDDRTRQGG